MKYNISLLSFILILLAYNSITVSGQSNSPKQYISGNIQFDVESYNNQYDINYQKRNSWNLYTGFHWSQFLSPKWVIGFGFGIESNYQKSIDSGVVLNTTISKANNYSLEASIRHVKLIVENWYCFSQLTIGAGIGDNNIVFNDASLSSFKNHLFKSSIGLGINYQFHHHWSVEVVPLQLEYRYTKKPSTDTSPGVETDSKIQLNSFTNGAYLSFNYHF